MLDWFWELRWQWKVIGVAYVAIGLIVFVWDLVDYIKHPPTKKSDKVPLLGWPLVFVIEVFGYPLLFLSDWRKDRKLKKERRDPPKPLLDMQ
jgi:hypothetical protein